MIERTISNIADFVEALRLDQNADGFAMWYRGHANAAWTLLPGLLRENYNDSEATLLRRRWARLLDTHLLGALI